MDSTAYTTRELRLMHQRDEALARAEKAEADAEDYRVLAAGYEAQIKSLERTIVTYAEHVLVHTEVSE